VVGKHNGGAGGKRGATCNDGVLVPENTGGGMPKVTEEKSDVNGMPVGKIAG
jgi:hypothetical protein